MNSLISPAARGEQPPLSLPVCARAAEGALGTVCLPAGGARRVPHGRGAPPSIASPALCAGLRLALFARSGERAVRMLRTNSRPPRSAGGDGDGDGDSAGHTQPAGAAARVSLGRAPRGAPGCSGISFRGES